MVWKAKTSLAELLRRRKQTLQEWMSQMGMTTLDDVHGWCATNDGVLDVPLPKVRARAVAPVQVLDVAAEVDSSVHRAPAPEDMGLTSPVEKKIKTSKKESNDSSSGTG